MDRSTAGAHASFSGPAAEQATGILAETPMPGADELRLCSGLTVVLGGEGAAIGSLTEADARALREHISGCAACRSLLASDDELRRRLALLREGEPPIDVLAQVMQQVELDPD
jgi:hypothetical protein